ncbi:helix-turn-helix domain-containing protein [Streptomyces sp. N2-109]|uniref:Helix-turn-helix domain-containing protein n=1 Tax=Streptomyces gossypii TaxID=2883101 RepID=A0ABT2K1A0_9ACTN|nr:helix-turn-helix transcriptional regulator [Streptomyces gossypii]MCT2593937.1 helix-turn-helix domain-containing protein [Streptomyces gossypii]
MVLGARLRKLREDEYISQGEAAEAIRATSAQLNRLELGRSGCRLRDVADLLTIYGVTDDTERQTMLTLAGQANVPGWWHAYEDVVPGWLQTYLGLEQSAEVIRGYEVQFVPGLLQTRSYARAVIALGHVTASAEELRRRVELRMIRQQILYAPGPPHLWAVIDEAALRRPVGGAATMRAQVRHLIAMCELPHVTVQILPFAAGGHAAAGGPVILLRLPEQGLPDVVYLEQLLSAHYPDNPEDIEHYRQVIDGLVTRAEPPTRTQGILRGILAESEARGPEENTEISTP